MAPEVYRKRPNTANQPQKKPNRPAEDPKRKTLSPEEKRRKEQKRREEIRRQKEERARLMKIRRARRKRLFRLSFWVAIVFVILYWSLVTVLICTRADGSENALPLLLFEQGKKDEIEKYEPEEICIGGTKYLPVTFLEDFVAISQFGDHKTRSFLICSNGEFATFYIGNEEAIVNGERVSMRTPALMIDGQLHLPVDFYAEKLTCFELGKNNATYGADVLTFLKDVEPGFSFRPCPAENPVDYATVPIAPTVPVTPAT